MPDVQSIGLGGGSRVRSLQGGKVSIGPDSVGHHVSHNSIYWHFMFSPYVVFAVDTGQFSFRWHAVNFHGYCGSGG